MTEENIKHPPGLRKCDVTGCPLEATLYALGFANCRYHFRAAGKGLAHITMVISNHRQEIEWYETMLQCRSFDAGIEDIIKQAPFSLAKEPGEAVAEYKARLEKHIQSLFVRVTV